MSSESLRARLEAALPGPKELTPSHSCDSHWAGDHCVLCGQMATAARLIERDRTDLRLALDVIEALRAIINGERDGRLTPTSPIWADARAALDAFEAAP